MDVLNPVSKKFGMVLKVDLETGLLNQANFVPSPNCDERPEGTAIELVVVHGISLPPGQFGGQGVQQLFTNQLNPEDDPYYKTIEGVSLMTETAFQ